MNFPGWRLHTPPASTVLRSAGPVSLLNLTTTHTFTHTGTEHRETPRRSHPDRDAHKQASQRGSHRSAPPHPTSVCRCSLWMLCRSALWGCGSEQAGCVTASPREQAKFPRPIDTTAATVPVGSVALRMAPADNSAGAIALPAPYQCKLQRPVRACVRARPRAAHLPTFCAALWRHTRGERAFLEQFICLERQHAPRTHAGNRLSAHLQVRSADAVSRVQASTRQFCMHLRGHLPSPFFEELLELTLAF